MKVYLLDTNIVIRIWKEYPDVLDILDKSNQVDYKVTNDIAVELSQKEVGDVNGLPVFSKNFLLIINHIVNNGVFSGNPDLKENRYIKQNEKGELYYVLGNKISMNDYSLIVMCQNYGYVLVTEDKRMYKSASINLDKSNIMNYPQFIEDLRLLNVI